MSFLMVPSLIGRRGKFEGIGGNTDTIVGIRRVHVYLNGIQTFEALADGIVDVFMVAGGGGSGSDGGGGGAGGFLVSNNVAVTKGVHTVTVGAGGAASAFGNDSSVSFGGLVNAVRGGRGSNNQSGVGGSGGGADNDGRTGGSRFIPGSAGTPGQGFAGGGYQIFAKRDGNEGGGGGGGGGAGAAGNNGNLNTPGVGGIGRENDFRTGSNLFYSGGGGGSSRGEGGFRRFAVGGQGGGGHNSNGLPNTGGGGGSPSHSGGSGIVIIRYLIDQ